MASCYTKAQRDLIASLQCQNKNLIRRIEKYESDPLFIRIKEEYEEKLAATRASYEKRVRELSDELRRAERKLERIGREWMEVVGDVEKEKDLELGKKDKEIERLREKAAEKASEKKEVLREATGLREKIHDLEDEIKKLRGRLDKDFTNSSTPSSRTQFRAPVKNSREPSGKKPGGQEGHEGHRRPKLDPTMPPIVIEAPREILDDPSWYVEKDRDGNPKVMKKTIVSARIAVDVVEYQAYVYRNRDTKKTYHAPLPGNSPTVEIEYDDSVRALAFLLNTHMNVSLQKTQEFLLTLSSCFSLKNKAFRS